MPKLSVLYLVDKDGNGMDRNMSIVMIKDNRIHFLINQLRQDGYDYRPMVVSPINYRMTKTKLKRKEI